MVKILIVTGRLAESMVRRAVAMSGTKHHVDIIVTPIPIAAFLTTEYVASYLNSTGVRVRDYDYILLPGLCMGSGRVIEDRLGVKAIKGTVHAYDLIELLKLEDLSILSPDTSADEILQNLFEEGAKRILMDLEAGLNNSNSFLIGGLRVAFNPPPMRIISEITEVHNMPLERLIEEVSRIIDCGGDVVSLGFEAYNPHSDIVERVVKSLKREFDIPIAIDTTIPSEIDVAIASGADMIVNVDLTNIDKINHVDRNVAVVTTPRNPISGDIPSDVDVRIKLLNRAVEAIRKRGFEKIFADAVLEPYGSIFKSLLAFHNFKTIHPEIPMFMGVGNVTELTDVDSVGVNALLTMLAHEIGVSMVLVVEKSVKAKGSTMEAKIASQMASIAKIKNCPPKNLGISLLILKDKRFYEFPVCGDIDEIVYAEGGEKYYTIDPFGTFNIRVNHKEKFIEALYNGRMKRILIKGRSAKDIRREIVSRNLISQISHAMYLGCELAKAEIALQLGKSYIQENPLFQTPKYIKLVKEP
ncbi:MAG: dihydropteroate synthase-like protein [Candidatus Methanomethylicia archaeon]